MTFNFSPGLLNRKINLTFLLSSLKTLTNSKECSLSRIKFLFRLFFTLIGWISLVCIHDRLSEQLLEVHKRLRKAGSSPVKKVPGRIFTFWDCIEHKQTKKCQNHHQHSFKKYCLIFFLGHLKKIFTSCHGLLKKI